MGKKRKTSLELLVEFFTAAPLSEVQQALLVARAIVAGRSPAILPARTRGRKPAAAVAETLGDA